MFILIRSIFIRLRDIWRAKQYDIVFVQREGFMLGTSFFERRISKKTNMIFDFDDSIWIPVVSEGNKKLSFLKDASKTAKLIEMARMVFAGNQYLADYALQFNKNTHVVATSIDTNRHQRMALPPKDRVCVGWTGSFSTIEHFAFAIPVLRQIKARFGDKVYFKVIGDPNYKCEELGIQGITWTEKDEIKELSEIDIGIMPLPDDQWTKGKCGLKGLQYMSLEIPTIMSPVGVNTEIIEEGVNGFLAKEEAEWVEKIAALIENPELRLRIGKAGRQTILDRYSVLALRDVYLNHFNSIT